jgi:hypothetical protein
MRVRVWPPAWRAAMLTPMNRVRVVYLCLALLLPLSLPAETAGPQLYQVELILFRQLDAVAKDAWPSTNRSRVPRNARALVRFDDGDTAPVDFFRVENSRLRLARAWQRMQGLGEVEPLLLMGWRQSHGLLRVGRRVRLDDETEGLSGFLVLRLGNRLVAEIDVTLDAPPAEPEPRPFDHFGDPQPRSDWRLEPLPDAEAAAAPTAEGFRLHQRRTIRLGEDHYFDHPAFGLILRVDRVVKD